MNAGDKVWVCEKGHVDDGHYTLGNGALELCSRCGGRTEQFTLDGLASRARQVIEAEIALADFDDHGDYEAPIEILRRIAFRGGGRL